MQATNKRSGSCRRLTFGESYISASLTLKSWAQAWTRVHRNTQEDSTGCVWVACISHSYDWCIHGEECLNITIPSIDRHVNELWLFPILLGWVGYQPLFRSKLVTINIFYMYLNFINVSVNVWSAFVISAKFVPLKHYTDLIAAHYCASFSARLIIALNMLSWMWPPLRRECANYKNGNIPCPLSATPYFTHNTLRCLDLTWVHNSPYDKIVQNFGIHRLSCRF